MNIENLQESFMDCYSFDICSPKVRDSWSEDNKCLGMCAITALIVEDYFGGEICKMYVDGISHYFNMVNGKIIDLTKEQFDKDVAYNEYQVVERADILIDELPQRYVELKRRVVERMLRDSDEKVFSCNACGGLVDKFPSDATVFVGKDQEIVLVGEAPANNGWRKSHMLWKDVNRKVLPSGVVLQKLFDIIGRNIFETTFLEAVKCYPLERKNLKVCSRKCKNIMLEQLSILNPRLIITLGEFPTRNLLDFKFDKFSDVVGNVYEVNGYKVLPIYHPSPISPKSYKGNVPIFEKLKREMES